LKVPSLFDSKESPKPQRTYRLSRSKVELYLECPRCFYLDQKLGIRRPSFPAFTLNSAVDLLLKKEFDLHRQKHEPHPLMQAYQIEAVPLWHEELNKWRNSLQGISLLHQETNLYLFGAIDDIWENAKGEWHVVDYKATSTNREIDLSDDYKAGYKKQVEFYQWLLRKRGFPVSKMAYFVFCNGIKNRPQLGGRLEFELSIVPHKGDDSWVEPTLFEIEKLLTLKEAPPPNPQCPYCQFAEKAKR